MLLRTGASSRAHDRLRWSRWRALAGLAAALLVVLLPGARPAGAQSETENQLIGSEPADGATIGASPTELVFTFAAELDPDDALTAPVSCNSAVQQVGIPQLDPDDERVVRVEVLSPFPRGACTIPWRLVDGLQQEITSGLITFSVQNDPVTVATTPAAGTGGTTPATTVPATAPGVTADDDEGSSGGALWLGRVLSSIGILVLFGALVLIGVAWPEGPEYVITVRFLRSMWALALIGTVLFVIAYTAEVTGESFGASINPGSWFDLTDAGWPGRAALARLLLVAATAWVVARPERVIDPTSQLAAYALPGLAVVAVGLSRTGGDLALVGVVMGIGHAIGAALWVGGAVLVARVVLAGPGDEDLVHAVRGFNRLSGPAIVLTIVTGLVQFVRLVGGALFTSGHGQVMLLKAVAVAAMVFVAMTVRQMVAARLARADEMTPPLADRFRRAFGAEAAIGVVVLALSGWLLALTPANDDGDSIDYAVEIPFVDTASGLDVEVSLTPAEVGLNGMRVEVNAPQDGISNLVVTLLPPEGSAARGIEQPIPLTTAGTATLDPSVGVPLDVAGTWTMQLSGVTATGAVSGAVRTFTVLAPEGQGGDGSAVTTPPSSTSGGPIVTVFVDPGLGTTATTAGG